jgi:uncharacterized protein (UPF0335 family)
MSDIGHNSSTVNAAELLSYVERAERLHEERKSLAKDISDIYGEAKANGFDTKILKKVVALRAQDRDKRVEEETILDLYLSALGMS